MLSIIVPAHNEEQVLAETLNAIQVAARAERLEYELIVVDDSSTDRTPEIARQCGARVISISRRQIAAARNAGAHEARGDLLLFVDADTHINAAALRGIVEAVDAGAAGGGCLFRFEGRLPLWSRLMYPPAIWLFRTFRIVGGCCLYATRSTFDQIGGFDERYYAAEELFFAKAVKRVGRLVIPAPLVVTSGRKLRAYSGWEVLAKLLRIVGRGQSAYQSRESLDVWYERRTDPDANPSGSPPAGRDVS